MTQNRDFDFHTGIEIWGGDNKIILNNYTITVKGTSGVFRSVNFAGSINLSNAAVDSQEALIFNDNDLNRFTLDSCWFSGVVGHRTFPSKQKYVITIQGFGQDDFTLNLVGTKISYGGSSTKDPTSFRIQLNSQINGLTTMLRDWAVVYGETHFNPGSPSNTNPHKYSRTKQGTLIRFDNNSTYCHEVGITKRGNPKYKRKFAYDSTVSWDPESYTMETCSGDTPPKIEEWLDTYPTFWGPTTKEGTHNPNLVDTFGNPGDIYHKTDTGDLFMKNSTLGSDNNWLEIGGDTNTDNQQLYFDGNTNLLSITDGGNVNLSSLKTEKLSDLADAKCVGDEYIYNVFISNGQGPGDAIQHGTLSGNMNLGIGASALKSVSDGGDNIAIGTNALSLLTTGTRNTIVGQMATQNATSTTSYNTIIGYLGGSKLDSNHNTAVGTHALRSTGANTTGGYNTVLGSESGQNLTSGNNNTYIGYNIQPTGDDPTVSHELKIGNGTVINIKGDMVTGDVEIGRNLDASNGSMSHNIHWRGNSNWFVADDDYTILTQSGKNVILPPNPNDQKGRIIVVKNVASGTVSVCTGHIGHLIDNSYNYVDLTGTGSSITLQSEGGSNKWWIIACCGAHTKKVYTVNGDDNPIGGSPW